MEIKNLTTSIGILQKVSDKEYSYNLGTISKTEIAVFQVQVEKPITHIQKGCGSCTTVTFNGDEVTIKYDPKKGGSGLSNFSKSVTIHFEDKDNIKIKFNGNYKV
jgi:hypothetical protein